jgi:hypothetical protein
LFSTLLFPVELFPVEALVGVLFFFDGTGILPTIGSGCSGPHAASVMQHANNKTAIIRG